MTQLAGPAGLLFIHVHFFHCLRSIVDLGCFSPCHQGTVVNATAFGVEWVALRCSPADRVTEDLDSSAVAMSTTAQAFCATFQPLFAFIIGAVCGAPATVAFSYYALAVPIVLVLFIMFVLGAERQRHTMGQVDEAPGTTATSGNCPCAASSILQSRVTKDLSWLHSPLSESDSSDGTLMQTDSVWATTGSRPILKPQSRDLKSVTF